MTGIFTRRILTGYGFAGRLAVPAIGVLAVLVACGPAAATGRSLSSPGRDKIENPSTNSSKPMKDGENEKFKTLDRMAETKKPDGMNTTKQVPTPCQDRADCRKARPAPVVSLNPGYQTCAQLAFLFVDYAEMAQSGNLQAGAQYANVKKQMIKQHCPLPKGY